MDPFSITVSCLTLIGIAGKTTVAISAFVRGCRDARSDLTSISGELTQLQLVLDLLKDDTDVTDNRIIPESLQAQILSIIANCSEVVDKISKVLEKYAAKAGPAKWTAYGKTEVEGLRMSLQAHRGSLSLVLELVSASLSKAIKDDTAATRTDLRDIKQDTSHIPHIMAELAELRAIIAAGGHNHGNNYILAQYLDSLTSYAETVCQDASVAWDSDGSMHAPSPKASPVSSPNPTPKQSRENLQQPQKPEEPELEELGLDLGQVETHARMPPQQSPVTSSDLETKEDPEVSEPTHSITAVSTIEASHPKAPSNSPPPPPTAQPRASSESPVEALLKTSSTPEATDHIVSRLELPGPGHATPTDTGTLSSDVGSSLFSSATRNSDELDLWFLSNEELEKPGMPSASASTLNSPPVKGLSRIELKLGPEGSSTELSSPRIPLDNLQRASSAPLTKATSETTAAINASSSALTSSIRPTAGTPPASPQLRSSEPPPRREVVVVGDCVGKTSLIMAFAKDCFPEVYLPTVVDDCVADIVVDGRVVELDIRDNAAAEGYDWPGSTISKYPDADVFMVTYGIDSSESYLMAESKWVPEIRRSCPNVPFILVGLRKDIRVHRQNNPELENAEQLERTTLKRKHGHALAEKVGAGGYYETSAKTGQGVREAFEAAARLALLEKMTTAVSIKSTRKHGRFRSLFGIGQKKSDYTSLP